MPEPLIPAPVAQPTGNAPAPPPEGAGKRKRGPSSKAKYPIPEGGKLAAWPNDFDSNTHAPLRRSDFADPVVYLNGKADALTKQADALRKEAEQLKQFGPSARKSLDKLAAIRAKLVKELVAIAASGVDVVAAGLCTAEELAAARAAG